MPSSILSMVYLPSVMVVVLELSVWVLSIILYNDISMLFIAFFCCDICYFSIYDIFVVLIFFYEARLLVLGKMFAIVSGSSNER